MNLAVGPVHGRVDADGRLLAADAPLAALQARAGGAPDGPLAIPQIAALVRLARRLGAPVARAVFAADGDQDLDLWVRARPDQGGVAFIIAGWTRRQPTPPLDGPAAAIMFDRLRADAAWTWECDAALRLTAVSREGLAALGLDGAASVAGDALTRLAALDDDGTAPPPLLAALADGHGFDDQRVTMRVGGARFRLAGDPVLDPLGQLRGFRGAAYAIVEEIDAPAPAADGGAFAIRLDAALRAPLQRIVATAEAIREQEDGPLRSDYGAYAGDIASAGRHLLGLVDDLVDLEAVERDDLAVERELLDLADLARRAAGLLSVRADDKGMRIERPDEDDRLATTGDFRRVLQVLVNLVGNAVRYGPEGSTVTVTVAALGERTTAAIVVDEGRGIAPEDRERVFEKFERLGAREPGSGLGLYISRRLARAMGGDVTIEGAPGEGARVVFTLPRAEAGVARP